MMQGLRANEGLDGLRRELNNKVSGLYAEINQVKVRDQVALNQLVRDEMYEQLK